MKYKIHFILMILGLITVTIILVMLKQDNFNNRYHQHQQLNTALKTELGPLELETHLPVIKIETNGQKIPGLPIEGAPGYQLSDQYESYIEASFILYQGKEQPQHLMAQLNYRGNSSRHFNKKSYSIRLIDDNKNDLRIPLLSMESDNNWSLNGPYLDRSLIRNYIAMNWAGEIMPYAPDVRFVEMFIDDRYEGLYVLMEKVSKGEGRVPVDTPERGSHNTSYIIRFDRNNKIVNKLNDFVMDTFRILPSGTELRYPTDRNLTEERQQFINQDFSYITYSTYQMPYNIHYDYADVLDVQAFYDYFIINELFRLEDAGQYSTYFYRNLGGKLTPVVWDFNNSLNNYQESVYDESGFSLVHSIFYRELLKDDAFAEGLIRRYHNLRKTKFATKRLHRYIDETVDFLGPAIIRNNDRWSSIYDLTEYDANNFLHPVERNVMSYQEAVQQVKDYLKERAEWLDQHIDILLQYSHPSRIGHKAVK